ncbi:MAG: nuclear transport factor 2 family protein [Gemmatimonadaceae bacterium]|nr:nuclear transport factor 2 family protein [Gemmatimonadaceae bacterium]
MSGRLRARVVSAVVALTVAAACRTRGGAAPTPQAEARAVEGAIRAWYDASERKDSAAYFNRLLPTFFIFEDTTRYDREAIVRLVVSSFGSGTDRATITDWHTEVAGDVAWTSFRNTEVFTPTNGAPGAPRRYLETAVLRKVQGEWKIERYHATRINRPAPR